MSEENVDLARRAIEATLPTPKPDVAIPVAVLTKAIGHASTRPLRIA
jgi:hypothetical protein